MRRLSVLGTRVSTARTFAAPLAQDRAASFLRATRSSSTGLGLLWKPSVAASPLDLTRARVHAGSAPRVRALSSDAPAASTMKSDSGGAGGAGEAAHVPINLEQARRMATEVSSLSNEAVFILSEQNHHAACKERLIRHVMVVDSIERPEASKKVDEISAFNKKSVGVLTLPYKVGIAGWTFVAVASVPMVFHRGVALWFGVDVVTADVPEAKDMETWLEIGSWTWGWMEPVIGTASFVLLAAQMVRAQMQNMNLKIYNEWAREKRASQLCGAYPQYSEHILSIYAESAPLEKKRK